MRYLISLLKVLEGFILFYLLFIVIRWYVKGHFGKYFILFWAYSIFCIVLFTIEKQKMKDDQDPRSGYQIWQENMKNYDAERGY